MATIKGSHRNDKLSGTKHADTILGRAGHDRIDGGKGDDLLFGGSGKDKLDGGQGNDALFGGSGNDKLEGDKGNDFLFGGSGHDRLEGGKGDDLLFGGAGHDKLDGGDGNDRLHGGSGNDRLEGGDGRDSLLGGSGNDRLDGGKGNDFLDGGAGSDIVKGGKGNDRANYNVSENLGPDFADIGTHDIYDGGQGFDTLQLTLTHGEFLNAAVKKDLDAFETFLDKYAKPGSDCGPTFHFASFNLDARDLEALAVKLVNEGPKANDDGATTDEDHALAGMGLLANDVDPDHLDELKVVDYDAASSLGAAVEVKADGSYTYNPTGVLALQMLAAGAWAIDSFGYTASDLAGANSSAMVEVQVIGVNDAPTDLAFEGGSVAEDAANGTVVASVTSVSDVDLGDTHRFSLTDNAGDRFAINDVTGEITVLDGSLLDAGASHAITVRATDMDGLGLSYDEIFVINVAGNNPPVAMADNVITNADFAAIEIPEWALLANDSDPDGNPLDVNNVVGMAGFVTHQAGNGANGFVQFLAAPGMGGPEQFTYAATDGQANSMPAVVNVSQQPLFAPLEGTDGSDIIVAFRPFPAALNGNSGNDILIGGDDSDTLDGGVGDDIIAGGEGDDTSSGAEGADIFRFSFDLASPTDKSLDGFDTIVDFVWGEDKLEFNGLAGLTLDEFSNLFKVSEGPVDGDQLLDTTLALADGTWEVNLLGVSGHDNLDDFYNDSLFS
jgi:VCBS repeat-containing protein